MLYFTDVYKLMQIYLVLWNSFYKSENKISVIVRVDDFKVMECINIIIKEDIICDTS